MNWLNLSRNYRNACFGFVTSLLAVLIFSSNVFAISPTQLGMLQSLSETDKQQLLNAVGGNTSGVLPGTPAPKSTKPVATTKLTSKSTKQLEENAAEQVRIQGGDSIFIHFKEPQDVNLEALLQDLNNPKKKSEIIYEPKSEKLLFKLDKYGVLDLSGIGRIALAGLTEDEAAARLNLEPLLQRFEIEVTILPLEPIGREALKPFGYELFKKPETDEGVVSQTQSLEPELDIPVPKDYVLGPGDVVYIQLFGKENQEFSVPISRDGSLSFPGIGVIPVAGLQFDQLKQDLKKRIKEQFIGVSAYITLAELRSFRVFVLGEVEQPGSYLVSGAATISNALQKAEGVKEIGSLRDVTLKRNGKVVSQLDLYDLLLKGDSRKDVRLQPGDVIHVPPILKSISVSGEIRRPAIYELKGDESIRDVVAMAGGLLAEADRNSIRVERIGEQFAKQVYDVDSGSWKSFTAQNGDVLIVRPMIDVKTNVIKLSGQVLHEDEFQWQKGIRITDIISSVDDLKPNADTDYVIVKRFPEPHLSMQVMSTNLRLALQHPKGEQNILLQPRDEIVVLDLSEKRTLQVAPIIEQLQAQSESSGPSQVVRVNGQVRGPGRYPLEKGMRISDLVRAGGRLKESAYTLEAELTRFNIPDGEIREMQHLRVDLDAILKGDTKADFELHPYDLLNIKEIPLWAEQDKVEIKGEVKFPGTYAIRRGETLSQLLVRAGGLTPYAYPEGAVFTREDLRKREQERMDEMAANLETEIALLNQEQQQDKSVDFENMDMAQQVLKKLRATKAAGRLVIDLPKVQALIEKEKKDNSIDIVLRGGDSLAIPPKMQEVSVIGQVFHPTSHLFSKGLGPQDYVNLSGGMTNKADIENVYIIRADGAVELAKQTWFLRSSNIKPGDTVVVPLDADRMNKLKLWSSISEIMYKVSLSAVAWNNLGFF